LKACIFACVSICVAGVSPALAQKVDCASLNSQFESSNKELSYLNTSGLTDDSAPRETNRQLKAVNERLAQSMVLDRMIQAKCALPSQLSDDVYYWKPAFDCAMARGDADIKEKCDRSKWTPIAAQEAAK